MPGWLDNAFHSHSKRELVALATDGLLARAVSRCGDLLSDGFVEDTWVSKQLLDGMLRPKQREQVVELAIEHRVFERLAAGETRTITGAARAGLRGAAIEVLLGPFAVDGVVVHDYLDCNRSRAEVEEIREREAAKKRRQRGGKVQEQLPWKKFEASPEGDVRPSVSPGESPGVSTGDSGDRDRTVEEPPTTEGQVSIDARADERERGRDSEQLDRVVSILSEVSRLRVDEIGVLNAMRAFPTGDPVLAAREVVAKFGNDSTRWQSFGSRLLWEVLERQTTPKPPVTGRVAQQAFAGRSAGRGSAPTAADFQALKTGGGAA